MRGGEPEYLMIPGPIAMARTLTSTAKLVFGAVRWRIGDSKGGWPGIRDLARLAGCSTGAVNRGITELETAGFLTVERRGRGESSVYRLPKSVSETETLPPPKSVHETETPSRSKCPRNGDTSVSETETPRAAKCLRNGSSGVHETETQVSPKRRPNQKRNIESKEPIRRSRAPNPLWDCIVERFFPSGVSPSDKTRVGRVVRDLAAKQATPEQVTERMAAYQQTWPGMACTPEALIKHWDAFNGSGGGGKAAHRGKESGRVRNGAASRYDAGITRVGTGEVGPE